MDGILYALVVNTSDLSVVADYTRAKGSYATNAKRVLTQVGKSTAEKRCVVHNKFCYAILNDGTLTYVAVTEEGFSRVIVFNFLSALRKGAPALRNNPSGLNNLLKKEANYYSDPKNDKITKIKADIDQVKDVMIDNIDKMIERGEKIESLVDKTDNLATESQTFEAQARDLRYKMLKKRILIMIIIGIVLLVIAFIIMLIVCSQGGINFKKCFNSGATEAPAPAPPITTAAPPPPPAPPIA